jgi:prepilin-type N-terminal cleavage/methylation domain-containing protein
VKLAVFADERGDSLVEILVAVAIIAIVLTAFLAALSTGVRSVAVVRERVTAENLARAQLEYIQHEQYQEVTQTTPGAYPTVTSIVSGYAITVTASPITATNDIQLITVTVSHHGESVLTIEDYKVDR